MALVSIPQSFFYRFKGIASKDYPLLGEVMKEIYRWWLLIEDIVEF